MIDANFELNGKLLSESMSSNEDDFQKSLPLTITIMLNANYPKLVGDPKTIAVHIKSDLAQHELVITHLLEGSSTSGGIYRSAESKTWVTLDENGALLVHDLTHRTEGIFFKENFFHQRVVKFQKFSRQ